MASVKMVNAINDVIKKTYLNNSYFVLWADSIEY